MIDQEMAFRYHARTAYDVEHRIGQDREGGKAPKADDETPCLNCSHIRGFHCVKYRKNQQPRFLWVGNYAQPRLRYPVRCRHTPPDATLADGPFRCGSSACAVADCDCRSFESPFRKPRAANKAAQAKPRKKATKSDGQQQFEFENTT